MTSRWDAKTNADAGDGYSDVMVRIEEEDIGIIIEFKYAENARFDAGCRDAMAQIKRMNYTSDLRHEGYRTIYKYGIACFKKKCRVLCEKEEYEPEEC